MEIFDNIRVINWSLSMDSYFEKGIFLKGTLWLKGDVHFGAHIEGEVHSNDHITIGASGYVKGNIHSYDFSNSGTVEGDVFSENKTTLMKGGSLAGDISTYQLVVDEGSEFGGRCKMIDAPEVKRSRGKLDIEKKSKPRKLLKLERRPKPPVESSSKNEGEPKSSD
ncbi:uncharacterized protein METZ01_LOCUS458190, partial [marine metagenome]